MSFYQIDDKLAGNPKVRRLIEGAMAGDYRGMAALGLWTLAGAESQGSGLDGLLSRFDLARITANPAMNDELAGLLVDAGLWHGPGHTCEHQDCPPVPDGSWRFHQYWQFKYDDAEAAKTTREKRAELKDVNVRDQVWARDCIDPANPNLAECRYCGRVVNRKDRSSQKPDGTPDYDRRAHLDHIDPSKAKGVRNLVVCCGACNNSEKRQRTPAQAGMTLRPAPAHSDPALDVVVPGSVVSPPTGAAGTTSTTLAVSPRTRAAETPQGHQGAATSPGDARGPQGPAGHAMAVVEEAPGAEQKHEQSTEQAPITVLGRTRAGGPAGAGRVGTGQGQGSGRGGGKGSGSPRSRRSRRRGRSRPQTDQRPAPPTNQRPPAISQPTWDAGPAPAMSLPGRWGSPYRDGRPGDDAPEARCPIHDEHLPCRRCRSEETR